MGIRREGTKCEVEAKRKEREIITKERPGKLKRDGQTEEREREREVKEARASVYNTLIQTANPSPPRAITAKVTPSDIFLATPQLGHKNTAATRRLKSCETGSFAPP